MARRSQKPEIDTTAYTHSEAKRKNNPEAGNLDVVPKAKEAKKTYNWDPREAPQLVWAGKAGLKMAEQKEAMSFEVPIVNLHIHERVAPEAIIRAVRREDAQRSLFADPQMDWSKEIQFYQHDVDWSNRMILGDSLQVMTSLLEREGMRGKVQMIFLDPPYGIKFGSNFQPRIDKRDVKDGADSDLTRQVEQVQAFRDTWELGVHSYLSYLRDRLIVARELLADSGSVFVQIGDENVHRVRCLLDEAFGEENFIAQISFIKTPGLGTDLLDAVNDTLIWFGRNKNQIKFRQLYQFKRVGEAGATQMNWIEEPSGVRRPLQRDDASPEGKLLSHDNLTSQTPSDTTTFTFDFEGRQHRPRKGGWKTNQAGMTRLIKSRRILAVGDTPRYVRFLDDFPVYPLNNMWLDTNISGFGRQKEYVVETLEKVVARCILMSTDPGDLVLDPTCGSGTTAFMAEQWGRRWITCDTSRVALAIARHRLMTGAFDYYKMRYPTAGVSGGFRYKTVPHVALRSITQNSEIDTIAGEYQPKIDAALHALNEANGSTWKEWDVPPTVAKVRKDSGEPIAGKNLDPAATGPTVHESWSTYLQALASTNAAVQHARNSTMFLAHTAHPELAKDGSNKEIHEVANTVAKAKEQMEELLGQFQKMADQSGASEVEQRLEEFWQLKREMQARIDASIQRNAPQEELVDQPEVERGVVRVSGPFTVEAVPNVSEISVDVTEKVFGDELQMQIFDPVQAELTAKNVSAYLSDMVVKLRRTGVVAKGRGRLAFKSLQPLDHEIVHAAGELEWTGETDTKSLNCAVVFGPESGSVSELLVRDGLRASMPYDAVLFCGYDFTGPAQEFLQTASVPGKQFFMAYIAPDTAMGDLLKDTKASQLFTLVGEPDVVVYRHGDPSLPQLIADAKKRGQSDVGTRVDSLREGEIFLELRGVDLYDPVKGEVLSDSGSDVHAIFVDHDYDGKSFCICQALFPNKKDSWNKIERALKAAVDEDAFEALRTQVTLPFRPGERMQVKVVDTRGNAVVKTLRCVL